jgi:hypothetical protein
MMKSLWGIRLDTPIHMYITPPLFMVQAIIIQGIAVTIATRIIPHGGIMSGTTPGQVGDLDLVIVQVLSDSPLGLADGTEGDGGDPAGIGGIDAATAMDIEEGHEQVTGPVTGTVTGTPHPTIYINPNGIRQG